MYGETGSTQHKDGSEGGSSLVITLNRGGGRGGGKSDTKATIQR